MKDPVVAVALSGGIDSLVSGYLLKQKYNSVFGIHFTTGYEQNPVDVSLLENRLGFDVHCIDLSKSFEEKVIRYFIQTYLEGKTPNPCLICNKEIKFGILMDQAKKMGADVLATGHYATIVNRLNFPDRDIKAPYLEKGADALKDQSYFLSLIPGPRLNDILFPLADMTKENVKIFAESKGLSALHPSESQDICFIHDNNFGKFILNRQNQDKQKLNPQKGNIIDPKGKIVGQHTGLHQFTIGQRRGINCPASEPYYVKRIDIKNNLLHVCFKKDLSTQKFNVDQIIWNFSTPAPIPDMTVKIRYSHKEAQAVLTMDGTKGNVELVTPQTAVTPGQAAAFYKNKRLLGAGIIL